MENLPKKVKRKEATLTVAGKKKKNCSKRLVQYTWSDIETVMSCFASLANGWSDYASI
jgi:hypothetical protein